MRQRGVSDSAPKRQRMGVCTASNRPSSGEDGCGALFGGGQPQEGEVFFFLVLVGALGSQGLGHMAHGTWLTAESLKLWERSTPKSLKTLDVDLGFAFLPTHRGQGFAREAAAATLAYARGTLGMGRTGTVQLTTGADVLLLYRVTSS